MIAHVQAIVLAAGKAKRFNTGKTKLIEKLCGQELIVYPIAILNKLALPTTLVVGFQAQKIRTIVEKYYPNQITYIEQSEALGTAHATKLTRSLWNKPDILIIKADMPLITTDIIESLYKKHTEDGAVISFVSAHNGDPSGFSYSKVIQTNDGVSIKTTPELSHESLLNHCCINGGIYLISRLFLEKYIDTVAIKKETGEYHLSELVNIASRMKKKVSVLSAPFDHVRGVSTFQELWAAEQIKRGEIIKYWMDRGVRFLAAQNVHIDLDIEIGPGSVVGCGAHLVKGSVIGSNCHIGPFSIIESTVLGENVHIEPYSILRNTKVGKQTVVGPFANLQDKTVVGDYCHIGNFVETKRSSLGNHTKAKHLTYLGDAIIGSHVNIGAGTITCNFDGKTKHTTHIEDHAFIGTNTSIVAPVTIHKGAFTAAGSVITKDVPEQALAIARAKQVNKEGYAKKLLIEKEEESRSDKNSKSKQALSFIGAVKTHSSRSTNKQ